MTSLPLRIALVFLLVVLAGCLSGAPATRLYVLAPLAENTAGSGRMERPVALVLRDLRLPQYLDRPQIVTRGSDHRLLISEYDQWGGQLREDMARILVENLGRLLDSDRIVAAPHALTMTPDYRLDVEVLRFERSTEGQVRLTARWWLMRGKDALLLASPEASFSEIPAGDGYEALVAAMSRTYGELARAIAGSVRQAGGT